MKARAYRQLDVFTDTALRGNPLAVVLDGEGLDEARMQAFAAWTQLSETTFVLPPTEAARAQGADYRVRIFTPGGELPFAGHPTLGTAHAWLQAGGQPQRADVLVQECAIGLVTLRQQQGRRAFAAPPLRRSTPDAQALDGVCQALGLLAEEVLAAQWLDNGPRWLGLPLPDVPPVAELGYPGFEANTWFAVFAPAKVPSEVLERLNAEINKALGADAVKERFAALSLDGQPVDRATLRRYLEGEVAKWGKVVKDNGLKAD